jgi:MoaA/NifB/PqqE/SkfB family radical SAM enzyme
VRNLGPIGVEPVVQLHPTRLCNIACAHCYTLSSPAARGELPLELLTAALDDAVALGYRQLAVSGGEPLVYRRLPELLAHAHELGMLTTVTTNGMLATPARWEPVAAHLDVAAVSIDGRPNEHDTIRRRAGAFARTVENLAVLRASGVPFGFIFTLTQSNADSIEFVVRLAAEHGARSVQVHPLTLQGRALEMLPESRPDGIELVAALLEAARLGRSLGVVVHVDALTLEQVLAYRLHLVPVRPVTNVVDVAPVLVIDADGAVLPMTHELDHVFALGSLLDHDLGSLAEWWLAAGWGDALAEACELAWRELTSTSRPPAVYWYDEVAAAAATLVPQPA